ncbi:hypothetical protein AMK21_25900 [Streptomyces sp. CB00316]|nr:hypothetical protein AMK21_25900 [Streptomyces sp. CB00316]
MRAQLLRACSIRSKSSGLKLPRLICTLRFCFGVTTCGYDASSGTAIFQVAAMHPRTITASRDMARRTR